MTLAAPARRALALALLVGFPVLVWLAVLEPLFNVISDRQGEIAVMEDQLEHYRAVAARRPDLERRLSSFQSAAGGRTYWTGSASNVTASIQSHLNQTITSAGGRLKSAGENQEAVDRGLRRISVRLSIDGTIETIQRTLSAIDATTPELFVESLAIAAPSSAPGPQPPVLSLELGVVGYAQPSP